MSISSYLINQKFINKIYLLEDGKKIEITSQGILYPHVRTLPICKIGKVDTILLKRYFNLVPDIANQYYPIMIRNNIYFLQKEGNISDSEIFQQIMEGKEIQIRLSETNNTNEGQKLKPKIIDI